MKRTCGIAGALLTAGLAVLSPGQAQTYPTQPVRIVVPFPPGGATDLLARKVAEPLAASLGQPVIVENRAGAGGAIGSQQVARSAPDGHTLVVGVTGSHSISAHLTNKPPYDPVKDFEPISLLVTAPLVLVVHPSMPVRNLAEFIEYAKQNPGKVTYGSSGAGTSLHLTGELFSIAAGTKMVHVPYKGSAQAMSDLVGGQINAMFVDPPVIAPYLGTDKLKLLAVTSRVRNPVLPDVPTMMESGLKAFEVLSWQGLFGPADMPTEVTNRLNREVTRILATPEVADFFAKQGFVVSGNTPSEFRAFVTAESNRWRDVVQRAGITAN